jgi:hypothetical protein
MTKNFKHGSLNLTEKNKIIFTSLSKKNFYLRAYISAFVLINGHTPISPFMNFEYNLSGLVSKDLIRISNNTLIKRTDELWVFGEISDGVLIEIYLAKKRKKPVKYFMPINNGISFEEIPEDKVVLEDVSPWMWEWVIHKKNLERWHPRLRFTKEYPLVYPAYSKKNFYWQMHINRYCLKKKVIPLNPFMLFRYFLGDAVPRETVYRANNNIVRICDEVWTFGAVSDGVLAEIKLKKEQNQPVKHFELIKSNPFVFRKIPPRFVKFEEKELEQYRDIIEKE